MNILLSINQILPATLYGGSERVIWDLGHALIQKGHHVTFLVKAGSRCDFAEMLIYNQEKPLQEQIPPETDVVHINDSPDASLTTPYLVSVHGNSNSTDVKFHSNAVFVSKNHAARYGSDSYVHNGLNWDAYPIPDLESQRNYFHFLGKAAWRKKNVTGAIRISRMAGEKLKVLGGTRLNFKMGFRFTPYPSISFEGMVNNHKKAVFMNKSKGLVFPVRWPEPFGLAVIESLFYGCPVFGTPYGSLSELVTDEVGVLSSSTSTLANALKNAEQFSKQTCHEYARDLFSASVMADRYIEKYEKVMNGQQLNPTHPQLLKPQTEKYLPFD